MDIEFHYHMTYLIAARAGYTASEAAIIAHAAQSVDDNHIPVSLEDSAGTVYENNVSQTMDITDPRLDELVYPIFHFIPGDPNFPGAARIDAARHQWNTTPDSPLANEMIDAALASKDLYRIGVSAHGYVDTWAHQNFVGKRDKFNEFSTGMFAQEAQLYFAVGHALAAHNPDWPGLVWEDSRLASSAVDNRARFLDAAERLFEKFSKEKKPAASDLEIAAEKRSLRADLDADIGERDDANANVAARIARYGARAATPEYGGEAMPPYVTGTWFSEAIEEPRKDVVEKLKKELALPALADAEQIAGDMYSDSHRQRVTWRNSEPAAHQAYHWWRFQEAVKAHLAECAAMLRREGVLPPAPIH